jgi:hypothetical protein
MILFNEFILLESFDSLEPIPVAFGSDVDFFGGGDSYTDKKFESVGNNLYRTVFKSDNVWVQVMFDRNHNELLFMTSDSDDITTFDTNKRNITGDIKTIFGNLLYIIPFLIRQLRPQTIMLASKVHTKKIYDYLYARKALSKIGLENLSKKDTGTESQYTFKVT